VKSMKLFKIINTFLMSNLIRILKLLK